MQLAAGGGGLQAGVLPYLLYLQLFVIAPLHNSEVRPFAARHAADASAQLVDIFPAFDVMNYALFNTRDASSDNADSGSLLSFAHGLGTTCLLSRRTVL